MKFCRNLILMDSRACNTRILKIIFDSAEIFDFLHILSQRCNHFLVYSASDEIRSSYAQPAMKFVPRMLSIFSMMVLKWVAISPYAEHARKLVTHWLSMREN